VLFGQGIREAKEVKKRVQSWLTLLGIIRPVKTGGPVNTGGLFLVLARDG
jgi:hypothetical protein